MRYLQVVGSVQYPWKENVENISLHLMFCLTWEGKPTLKNAFHEPLDVWMHTKSRADQAVLILLWESPLSYTMSKNQLLDLKGVYATS